MNQCLSCGATKVEPFLDLGMVPLANALLEQPPAQPGAEFRARLEVGYCHACSLVQLTHLVPPERLFSEYFYFSSFSDEFLRHAKLYVDDLVTRFSLGKDSFVVEVASNDGYLLKNVVARGMKALGVEPAKNIAKVAVANGVPTLNDFFGPESAQKIAAEHGKADVVLGNNVLAHVPKLVPFLTAARDLLKPAGVCVWEFPWLRELVRGLEFDTIYHEHVFYFSLGALRNAARLAGLEVFDVAPQKVHGGSLRVFLARPGTHQVTAEVDRILNLEKNEGLLSWPAFSHFGARVAGLRTELRDLLGKLKKAGKSIVAYGASAKGSTLINYCGIGKETLDYIVDRSTVKQGKFAPGVHLPILPADELARRRPDYALLLAWNFADEIRKQQRGYEQEGGHFIVPVPKPRVVG